MTARKSDNLLRGDRTPKYVDRATGAAELVISPETWDQWVKDGRLPPAASGFPDSAPRWRWDDVDAKLSGKTPASVNQFVARAGTLAGHGKKKDHGRDAA
jgi:hypothetical protein